mmetsp:Transcript_12202/g.32853  ORF Transcript_12202/g.32853 Transcript_12202/m.32853 type:complete len:179 (-) Transcript_12202:567-1103(-)
MENERALDALREAESRLAALEQQCRALRAEEGGNGGGPSSTAAADEVLCADALQAVFSLMGAMSEDERREWSARMRDELLPPLECAHCARVIPERAHSAVACWEPADVEHDGAVRDATEASGFLRSHKGAVGCPLGCSALFCSASCRRAAWGAHRTSCGGVRRARLARDLDQKHSAEF